MAQDPYLRFALKKELLQTRAAAERLELRSITTRLHPGTRRSVRLSRWLRLATILRTNPLTAALTGAVLARMPFGRFWRLGSRLAGLGLAGYQLYRVVRDFSGR